MKKLFYIAMAAIALTFVGCDSDVDWNSSNAYAIKGHTFEDIQHPGLLEFTFNRNMSVVYKWQNTWETNTNKRDDLHYTIDTETTFTIFSDDTIWGEGVYYNGQVPYITLSNFKGDTLTLKK